VAEVASTTLAEERETTGFERQAAEGARRMTHDESVALRWVSEGASAEIERLRVESRWAEQMLQYLRPEIVEARGDSSRYQALGRKAESEVKAEQQACTAVEARLGDIRRAQKEEFQSELKQQKQQSDAELAKRDERVRALEVEVEEKSWSSAWDRSAWPARSGCWSARWGSKANDLGGGTPHVSLWRDIGEQKENVKTHPSEKPLRTETVTIEPVRVQAETERAIERTPRGPFGEEYVRAEDPRSRVRPRSESGGLWGGSETPRRVVQVHTMWAVHHKALCVVHGDDLPRM
jgi:hypothetical protein